MSRFSRGYALGSQPASPELHDLVYNTTVERWQRWNGSGWVDTTAGAVASNGASLTDVHVDASVVNSTAETNLAVLAVPVAVAPGDVLHFRAFGDQINNSAGSVNYTYKVYLGSTTVLTTSTVGFALNAARRKWRVDVDILVLTTASQRVGGLIVVGPPTSQSWAPSTSATVGSGYGVAAEDLTAGKNVTLSVTLGTADAAADCVLHGATLEISKR